MPAFGASPEDLLGSALRGDNVSLAGSWSYTATTSGWWPGPDRSGPSRPARRVRPGPGDIPQGPSRVLPVPGLDRARAGRLAPADSGPELWPTRPGITGVKGRDLPAGRAAGASARAIELGSCSSAGRAAFLAQLPSPVAANKPVLLADALEKLPADYREVFFMRNLEHIPFEEIAARMGRSPGQRRNALDPNHQETLPVAGGGCVVIRERDLSAEGDNGEASTTPSWAVSWRPTWRTSKPVDRPTLELLLAAHPAIAGQLPALPESDEPGRSHRRCVGFRIAVSARSSP